MKKGARAVFSAVSVMHSVYIAVQETIFIELVEMIHFLTLLLAGSWPATCNRGGTSSRFLSNMSTIVDDLMI